MGRRTWHQLVVVGVCTVGIAISALVLAERVGGTTAATPTELSRWHMVKGCPFGVPTEGFYDCYHADQKESAIAEFKKATGTDPLIPTPTVRTALGLRLKWVAIYWGQVLNSTPEVRSIDFVYGHIPGGTFNSMVPPRPRFIDVTETTGTMFPPKIEIVRECYGQGVYPCPWQATFGDAARPLEIYVTGNESQGIVRMVASRLRAS